MQDKVTLRQVLERLRLPIIDPAWSLLGYFGILAAFMILSFYSVIGGWSLNYTTKAALNVFSGMSGDATGQMFDGMLANAKEMTIWHTVFMGITAFIVAGGVTAGIEKASKIMMPALAFILLFIVGYNAMNMDLPKVQSFYSSLIGRVCSKSAWVRY